MSFGIIQTFLSRLTKMNIIGTLPELSTVLRQFQVQDQQFEAIEYEIVEEERQPMIEIPAYRDRAKTIAGKQFEG
jgi:glucosyl-3-phosphoglycerate synthase